MIEESEKTVNCGECVHFVQARDRLGCDHIERNNRDGCAVDPMYGPHHCPHFETSPLARIADALDRLAWPNGVDYACDCGASGTLTRPVDKCPHCSKDWTGTGDGPMKP